MVVRFSFISLEQIEMKYYRQKFSSGVDSGTGPTLIHPTSKSLSKYHFFKVRIQLSVLHKKDCSFRFL